MQEFREQLWLGLLALMTVLVFLQFIWLKWSLKQLAILQKELVDIEQGKSNNLQALYPKELDLVTNQLNTLLKTEQNQRKRYRNALADLAHSLKTPLAVIQAQGELSSGGQEQLDSINLMIEHQLKRAQSAGQSSWHLGVEISPCLNKLTSSLKKIYSDKSIEFTFDVDEKAVFKGDESDLFEILGNLLDNACKAARSKIAITINQQHEQLIICIEDDGSGIDLSKRQDILQRGTRVDTYQQGHGIGLAIVRDLVESYQGQLLIEDSTTLCGAKFTLFF
jgi:two-component system sensor histidine kinase PhoQ